MSLKNQLLRHTIKAGLRLSFKLPGRLPLSVGMMRSGMDMGARLLPLRAGVQVERLQLKGVPTECVGQEAPTKFAILHLHGGAFIVGSPASHRALAGELAARTGAKVYVPDYRLAPEHPCPAALDDCLAAWEGLLDAGFAANRIVLSGDSAGGALALALVQQLRATGKALPAALILLSPYVDSTLEAASVRSHRWRDPMLSRQVLRRGSDSYRGELDAADPRISPLFGDIAGLPPLLLQAGSEEVLLDDTTRLASRCEAAGAEVTCRIYPGMWHDFQLFGQLLPEAAEALDEMAAFAHRHWA